jgi:hypothetical protein
VFQLARALECDVEDVMMQGMKEVDSGALVVAGAIGYRGSGPDEPTAFCLRPPTEPSLGIGLKR